MVWKKEAIIVDDWKYPLEILSMAWFYFIGIAGIVDAYSHVENLTVTNT